MKGNDEAMESITSFSRICGFIDTIQSCMDDYLYVYDYDNDVYHIAKKACEHFRMSSNHFNNVAEEHKKFVHPEDYELVMEDLEKVYHDPTLSHNMQYRWIDLNGNSVWVNCRGCIYKDSESRHLLLIGCINDIGSVQKADNISGLLSMPTIQELFHSYTGKPTNGYLLRLGIDDFKEINEKLGSDYGDLVIKKTAHCISECLLPNQQLYRLIGDEFIIIDTNGNPYSSALDQYKNIRSKIDCFIEENHYEAVYTISAGILPLTDNDHYTLADYLKLSDFALSEAKRIGKNHSYVFEQETYDKFIRRRNISKALRQAVNHNFEGFEVYLQPIYNVFEKRITAAEALLRFSTPEFGMISPFEFVPILEDSGLILPVGKWVLHRSLYLCQEISKEYPGFRIGINVSYIQIAKSNIISEIISSVSKYDINPEQVTIELTESGRIHSDVLIKKMWKKLKLKGINLALDDFGTGYSNFEYIDDIRPNIIKIDRSLTVHAMENEYIFHMLSLISHMVHTLNIRLCIEGIETEQELNRVQVLEPDILQGYFWGKPCPYDEFRKKYIKE